MKMIMVIERHYKILGLLWLRKHLKTLNTNNRLWLRKNDFFHPLNLGGIFLPPERRKRVGKRFREESRQVLERENSLNIVTTRYSGYF